MYWAVSCQEGRKGPIVGKRHIIACGDGRRGAFTLVELLVVISIIALVMGILAPALNLARWQARRLLGMSYQRKIIHAVSLYATDGDERFPESIATIGWEDDWSWQEPMKLVGYNSRSPRYSRSLSAYLGAYIEKGTVMHCPGVRRMSRYLEEAWAAGDNWDNPETPLPWDALSGTYCFYWNYEGYLEDTQSFFLGPRTQAGGRGSSKLLMSEYLAKGHWYEGANTYVSCEKFERARLVRPTMQFSGYWAGESYPTSAKPEIKLNAGYVDGHVESYSSSDTAAMLVIRKPETGEPYPDGTGPGKFFIPQKALH